MDVSICVATYRRPEGLARLLASLARAKRPEGIEAEVVVVDNDPQGTASGDLSAGGLPLRRVHEPRRNIAHARNRAVEAARGRWIAFVDDDEVVHEDWLAAHWDAVEVWDADGTLGPVLPRLERPGPAWLDPDTFYARPRRRTGEPALGVGGTGNAFLRRALFDGQRFDPAFGRSGGEDADLVRRLRAGGARLLWCDEARVDEFVAPERHRVRWLVRRHFRGGVTHVRVEHRDATPPARMLGVLRAGLGLAACAAALLPAAVLGPRPATLCLLRGCRQAGRLWAYAGGRFEEYRG